MTQAQHVNGLPRHDENSPSIFEQCQNHHSTFGDGKREGEREKTSSYMADNIQTGDERDFATNAQKSELKYAPQMDTTHRAAMLRYCNTAARKEEWMKWRAFEMNNFLPIMAFAPPDSFKNFENCKAFADLKEMTENMLYRGQQRMEVPPLIYVPEMYADSQKSGLHRSEEQQSDKSSINSRAGQNERKQMKTNSTKRSVESKEDKAEVFCKERHAKSGKACEIPKKRDKKGNDNISDKAPTSAALEDEESSILEVKRIYKCKYCDRKFSYCCHMKVHERVHTGEKPYTCKHCSNQFSQLGSLTVHMRIHTGAKPYRCVKCKKVFRHVNSLRRHQRQIHSMSSSQIASTVDKRRDGRHRSNRVRRCQSSSILKRSNTLRGTDNLYLFPFSFSAHGHKFSRQYMDLLRYHPLNGVIQKIKAPRRSKFLTELEGRVYKKELEKSRKKEEKYDDKGNKKIPKTWRPFEDPDDTPSSSLSASVHPDTPAKNTFPIGNKGYVEVSPEKHATTITPAINCEADDTVSSNEFAAEDLATNYLEIAAANLCLVNKNELKQLQKEMEESSSNSNSPSAAEDEKDCLLFGEGLSPGSATSPTASSPTVQKESANNSDKQLDQHADVMKRQKPQDSMLTDDQN